ncbi:hypothetical protein ACWDFL_37185 [Streptomyces bungoensis]
MDDDHWDNWPERWVGTDCDVRAAVSAIHGHLNDDDAAIPIHRLAQ